MYNSLKIKEIDIFFGEKIGLISIFSDPEKVEHGQPENKPLLSGGASADPEKPPYDASVDTKQ